MSSGPAGVAWSRGRTRCSRSTTPACLPTRYPPATSTPGGSRLATRPPTCSPSSSTTCCPPRPTSSTSTPIPRCGPPRHPGSAAPAARRRGLALSYAFEPGSETDGVTIDIPLKTLNQARPEEFSWHVPGLRLELVTELIRSLPKNLRRELVPAPNVAREILADPDAGTASDVRDTISRAMLKLRRVRVTPDDFDLDKLPPHLRITFRVLDGTKVVASGKDLAALQRQLRPKVRATLSARATGLTRTGVTSWNFGPLPRVFTDGEVKAYPALVDGGAGTAR